jgi:hypothetical protein
MTTDIAKIAAGLTKAQRELLELAATNDHAVTLEPNIYMGLTKCLLPYDNGQPATQAFTITKTGLEVRAHPLANREGDDA